MSNVQGTGGIVNIGFTCYANAVLQAFRAFPKIESLFKEGNYNSILKHECKYNELTKQFANVLQTLGTLQSTSSVRPMGFWSAFREAAQNTCFEHLCSHQPHDAHEFLMFLLDSLHESLSGKVHMNIRTCELKSNRQTFHQTIIVTGKQIGRAHV